MTTRRQGELTELVVESRAMQRDCPVTVYLPAGIRRTKSYPLLVVHDGSEFLQYAAAKVVLDNLIHRREIAKTIVAFLHPKDRLVEYANSPQHARFLSHELSVAAGSGVSTRPQPFRPRAAGRQLWSRRSTVCGVPIPTPVRITGTHVWLVRLCRRRNRPRRWPGL